MAALGGISNLVAAFGTSSPNNVSATSEAAPAAVENKGQAAAKRVDINQDQTSVSSAASLVAQVLNTSDTRLEKVAAIQAQIANGTYQVPAVAVASKIVEDLLKS